MEQEALAAAYGAELVLTDHYPRYNIAPSMGAPVLVVEEGGRHIRDFRWGLVPFWAKDPKIGNRMINARAESVAAKPAYRSAWREGRRCLVLADGFYEWKASSERRGSRTPHWISMADGRPFGFAGLWERWRRAEGEGPLLTFTILTIEANAVVKPIHDRMPVVLGDESGWNAWIDPRSRAEALVPLLAPYPSEEMHAVPVSPYVNKPGNEGRSCIEPVP